MVDSLNVGDDSEDVGAAGGSMLLVQLIGFTKAMLIVNWLPCVREKNGVEQLQLASNLIG